MARSSVMAENLPRLVDADAERVLLGDVDLDPAAALGDDAAAVQLAVAGLGLDDEIDAGRAVQLADDDALGAVDDELAAADHDRHVAQVDFFLDGLLLVEAQPDAEGPAIGQAQLPALVGAVARLAQLVPDVLQAQASCRSSRSGRFRAGRLPGRSACAFRAARRAAGSGRRTASARRSAAAPRRRRRSGRSCGSCSGMMMRWAGMGMSCCSFPKKRRGRHRRRGDAATKPVSARHGRCEGRVSVGNSLHRWKMVQSEAGPPVPAGRGPRSIRWRNRPIHRVPERLADKHGPPAAGRLAKAWHAALRCLTTWPARRSSRGPSVCHPAGPSPCLNSGLRIGGPVVSATIQQRRWSKVLLAEASLNKR